MVTLFICHDIGRRQTLIAQAPDSLVRRGVGRDGVPYVTAVVVMEPVAARVVSDDRATDTADHRADRPGDHRTADRSGDRTVRCWTGRPGRARSAQRHRRAHGKRNSLHV